MNRSNVLCVPSQQQGTVSQCTTSFTCVTTSSLHHHVPRDAPRSFLQVPEDPVSLLLRPPKQLVLVLWLVAVDARSPSATCHCSIFRLDSRRHDAGRQLEAVVRAKVLDACSVHAVLFSCELEKVVSIRLPPPDLSAYIHTGVHISHCQLRINAKTATVPRSGASACRRSVRRRARESSPAASARAQRETEAGHDTSRDSKRVSETGPAAVHPRTTATSTATRTSSPSKKMESQMWIVTSRSHGLAKSVRNHSVHASDSSTPEPPSPVRCAVISGIWSRTRSANTC